MAQLRSTDAEAVQRRLVDLGYLRDEQAIDGIIGPRTRAALSAFQLDKGLKADGIPGPLTLAALAIAPDVRIPGVEGEQPEPLRVLSTSEVERIFGRYRWTSGVGSLIEPDPDWVAENIRKFSFPDLRGIRGCEGKGSVFDGYMRLHKLAGPVFEGFVSDAFKAGLGDKFLSWDGATAFRRMRGSNRLSRHAWGIAVDFNADWNPFGGESAAPGEEGSLWELVPLMRKYGIASGLFWSNPDGMHCEVACVG